MPEMNPERDQSSALLRTAREEGVLSDAALEAICDSGAVGAENDALVAWCFAEHFPTLAGKHGIDLPTLTRFLAREAPGKIAAFVEASRALTARDYVFAHGARPPEGARWTAGTERRPGGTQSWNPQPAELAATEPIDVRRCLPWPVRDQWQRPTSVAFAATACMEQHECRRNRRLVGLSEQFLHHEIKTRTRDPAAGEDATCLEYARDALVLTGICTEAAMPYSPVQVPDDPGHAKTRPPIAAAYDDAAGRLHAAAIHERIGDQAGAVARTLRDLLAENRRPVAISLPVFADPLVSRHDNWNTRAGLLYGMVLDPPPGAVTAGGHAVCVTGFAPDAREPNGGYFVVRNSWSITWGQRLASPGFHGPERGYGQVSATYVENFLWEYMQL